MQMSSHMDLIQFTDSIKMILSTFSSFLSKTQKPVHQRSVFKPRLIPVMYHLQAKNETGLDAFSFKLMSKAKTLSGIQLLEITVNNVKKLIDFCENNKQFGVHLLFGYLFSCHCLVDPNDYPNNKSKPLL